MPADAATAAARDSAATSAGVQADHPVMHTAEEAARLLKVKRSWLERQAAARRIPFSMLGGSYLFSDWHLAEIIRLNEVVPAAGIRSHARPERLARTARIEPPLVSTATPPLRPRPRTAPRHA